MVPANNTTMERELLAWLPGSSCVTLRIGRGKGLLTRDSLGDYNAGALELAASFAAHDIDVVVFGCTAAGFMMGPRSNAEFAGELGRVTGKPVVTTAHSMVCAMREAKAKEIAVVTPYSDEVNRQLTDYLDASAVRVKRLNSFRAPDTAALGRITSAEVRSLARDTMGEDCDGLFIACTQLPTYEILDGLRRESGRPVWSSVHATASAVPR
jgi:maleate isomerase